MSFSSQVISAKKKMMQKTNLAYRKIFFDVSSLVVIRTPVQDGFLRGGWQPSKAFAIKSDNNIADKSGSATISNIGNVQSDATIHDDLYMTNNKPYAYRVEFLGHSQQRAEGMMRSTVDEYQQIVKKVARSLR